MINIVDMHCDALMKLSSSKELISFQDSPSIDSNKERLIQGGIRIQGFAVWVDPNIPSNSQFDVALAQISLFYNEVLAKNPDIKHIKNWQDLNELKPFEIGAILTLEGVESIGNDLNKLRVLYELGVRSVGLTWNHANLAADGAEEPRGSGLTLFGREIIRNNNKHAVLTDVSHLSERAFWEVIEVATYVFASHSNAKRICDHPRNLSDSQAKAIFDKGGTVHIVYYPPFVKKSGPATIIDLIKHIDHLCALGGVNHVGFGSDFDGINHKIIGLNNASESQNLINELLKYYSEEEVRGFAYQNFLRIVPT